jgi:BASS family bile acid:Na+ symporter
LGWLGVCGIAGAVSVVSVALGHAPFVGPAVVVLFAALALAFMSHAALRGVAFTVWVLAFVAASMFYPAAFGTWFGRDLKILIVPLIQIIMFGMGTTLSGKDFARVLAMPWPVFLGMVLQFSVMPLAGLSVAAVFGFEPEIAAGVILIGSVPGGVASNLMAYLARGDVALSVTMTACSTLLSPLMTPLLMKVLAGRLVPIDFWEMVFSILDMIIVPIVAGLAANKILYGRSAWFQRAAVVAAVAVGSVLAAVAVMCLNGEVLSAVLPASAATWLLKLRGGVLLGLALIAAVAAAKLVIGWLFRGPGNWMDRALPTVSMAGICFIIAIITARSREQLLTVGLALIAAAIVHNTTGYVLGFWIARLAGLNETACRTVAIEVGLQNGGMASGLAINVLHSPSAALAPAIFGPWMNVSGSVLATWWHRRPVRAPAC